MDIQPIYEVPSRPAPKGGRRAPPRPPSLFILSLPRSLSSLVHTRCCQALGLQSPNWTSDGEIMNVERSAFLSGPARGVKYTLPHHTHQFDPAMAFLSEVVQSRGFCYKDVTQPFATAAWLRTRPDIRVLKIVPNIAHASLAMLRRNWLYPTGAAPAGLGDIPIRLVAGLLKAAADIAAVPGEAVAFDALLSGPAPLRQALARLYPRVEVPTFDFGSDFEARRDAVLSRRALPDYQALEALAARLSAPDATVRSGPEREGRPVAAALA